MTCARCAALEAELRTLRSLHGTADLQAARLMQWWDVGETTARVALRLFAERFPVAVPDLVLSLHKARNKRALMAQVSMLRAKMDVGAIDTILGAYRLTEIGRAEIERALATPASLPATAA